MQNLQGRLIHYSIRVKVAVIGAGPIGIYCCAKLLKNGYDVTLIEAGDFNNETKLLTRENYHFKSRSAMPIGVHKVGGGSNLWRARLNHFIESDFESSLRTINWPIKFRLLSDHYDQVYRFLNVDRHQINEDIDNFLNQKEVIIPEALNLRIHYFTNPRIFLEITKKIFKHERFHLLTKHLCQGIYRDENEKKLVAFLKTESDEIKKMKFDKVIIAAGAMQSAALIEKSLNRIAQMKNEAVGKYLMEHLEGYVGTILVGKKNTLISSLSLNNGNRLANLGVEAGVSLTIGGQDLRLPLNVQFEIRPYMKNFRSRNWLADSSGYLMRRFLNVCFVLERLAFFIERKFLLLLENLLGWQLYSLYIKSEELPYKESKLFLNSFVENQLIYDHQVSASTYELLILASKEFFNIITSNKLGKIWLNSRLLDPKGVEKYFGPNWHPMGTCRMGKDPSDSVCDINLELHAIKNTFVVGSCVFPTGSNSNPTFTALALANRLVEEQFKSLEKFD